MTERGRREYAAVMRARYAQADKRARGRLLDEYCRTTGCHRKAAIRRLRTPAPPRAALARPPLSVRLRGSWPRSSSGRGWPVISSPGSCCAPSSPRCSRPWRRTMACVVAPAVHTALTARQRGHPRPAPAPAAPPPPAPARARSPRALAPLRAQVPLRTWREWAGRGARGALQGDLVLHCGESTAGLYCATLVAVDVATTWTDLQAIWGLHQQRVTGGIQHIAQRLPFPLREWHSDNGSEFINACLLGWCQRRGVRFTRGRPYRKNDQAWVEQRNGLLVRRLVGYDRYSSRAAWAVLQRLYGLLRLQHNFFRPVRKLLSKHRVGQHGSSSATTAAQTPVPACARRGGPPRRPAAGPGSSSSRLWIPSPSPATSSRPSTSCGSWPILAPARQEAARG